MYRSLGVIMYILLSGNPPFFMECGNDCGWERGDFCQLCQDLLFNSIQEGIYDFPENEWGYISDDAKDLIQHLLVKDASQRYTAEMVLKHRWVAQGGPVTPLETPSIMRKNNSYKDLNLFANGANQIKRLILNQQNLSSDYKSTLENHIEEQFVGSYKNNSSSLVLTPGTSSPTFELQFTSDEDGDAFLSDLDQRPQSINTNENSSSSTETVEKIDSMNETSNSSSATPSNTNSTNNINKKSEIKTVKWVDLQEDEDDFDEMLFSTKTIKDHAKKPENNDDNIQNKCAKLSLPMKSALKSSIDRNKNSKPLSNIVEMIKNKKKKKTIKRNTKNGSTSTSNSSSDESSDYNNNQFKSTQMIVDGEDADIDEINGSKSSLAKSPKHLTPPSQQQIDGNRNKIQKMLEYLNQDRKKLTLSASCYVNSRKNNQTASLNYSTNQSMLII